MGPSMASLCSLVLALPLFASALSTLPNGYIVSLNPAAHDARGSDKSVLDAFAADAKKAGISYTVRHTFDSRKIFTGLSLVLRNGTDSAKLATLPSVDLVEPVLTRTVKAAVKKPASAAVVKPVKASAVDADGKIVPSKVPALFTDVPLDSALIRSYNPHVLTGIDKLHAQGITGKGQTVCVLDTGVDWQHPSLGGEFGGDNKVYIAWSKGSYDDDGRSIIDKDGHGTHCAGSVAANPNNYGFAGAAPDARLGGFDAFTDYKTRNADGTEQSNDAGIGAIIAAGTNDNCDVLSMSYGGQDNGWLGAAQSVAVRNAAELKFLSIAAGNDADRGLFYGGGPDVAGAAYGGAIGNVASTNVQTFSLVSEANDKIPYFTPQPFTFYGAPEQLTVVKAGSSWRDPASFVQQGYTPPAGIDPATSVFVLPVGAGVESSGEGEEGDATFDADGPGGEEAAAPEEGEAGQRRRLRSRAVSTKTGELEFKYVIFASPANQEPDFNDIKPSKGLKPLETSDAAAHALYRLAGQTVTVGNTVDSTLTTSSKKRMVDSSTYGPNWTLDAAYSTLSGVGGNIMSTFPIALGGSAFLTGTSMATPLVAGVAALIRSGGVKTTSAQIRTALANTAVPVELKGQSGLDTVLKQGSGLVNAFCAYTTTVSAQPIQLLVGDLGGYKQTQTITITNSGTKTVAFVPTHRPALTVEGRKVGAKDWTPGDDLVRNNKFATVKFSPERISVAAGKSATVKVTITPPKGQDAREVPVFTGNLIFKGNDGECSQLNVPYQGLSAKTDSFPYLTISNSLQVGIAAIDPETEKLFEDKRVTSASSYNIDLITENQKVKEVELSPRKRDAVVKPANARTVQDFQKDLQRLYGTVAARGSVPITERFIGRNVRLVELGPLFGTAPAGKYRVLIRAIRPDANDNQIGSWDAYRSAVFSITR